MNETNKTKRASERASETVLVWKTNLRSTFERNRHASRPLVTHIDTDTAGSYRENEGGDTLSTHAIETRWRANEQANGEGKCAAEQGLIVNLSHFRCVVKQFVGFIVVIRSLSGVACIRVGSGQRSQDSEGPINNIIRENSFEAQRVYGRMSDTEGRTFRRILLESSR